MARLRYSLEEARAEATRRADAFIASRPDRDAYRFWGTDPNPIVPPSRTSKHPVAWVAWYAPIPPEGSVIDGGELTVAVDLEAGSVSYWVW